VAALKRPPTDHASCDARQHKNHPATSIAKLPASGVSHEEKFQQSRRTHQARTATFGVESLESRQSMSVAPGVGSVAAIGPISHLTVTLPKTPLVDTGTKTILAIKSTTAASPVRVTAQTAAINVAGQNPVVPPPSGGNTVAAKKSLWGKIKAAAKWAKDHIVIGLHNIGIKGTF